MSKKVEGLTTGLGYNPDIYEQLEDIKARLDALGFKEGGIEFLDAAQTYIDLTKSSMTISREGNKCSITGKIYYNFTSNNIVQLLTSGVNSHISIARIVDGATGDKAEYFYPSSDVSLGVKLKVYCTVRTSSSSTSSTNISFVLHLRIHSSGLITLGGYDSSTIANFCSNMSLGSDTTGEFTFGYDVEPIES